MALLTQERQHIWFIRIVYLALTFLRRVSLLISLPFLCFLVSYRRLIRPPFIAPKAGPLCYTQRVEARPEGAAPPGNINAPAGAEAAAAEAANAAAQAAAQAQAQAAGGNAAGGATGDQKFIINLEESAHARIHRNDPLQGVQPTQGGSVNPGTPDGMLKHISFYTGLDDLENAQGNAKASLKKPENLEYKRVAQHYFSDIDPRAKYAVLGTPGGDTGEFLLALATNEKMTNRLFYIEDVSSIFQDYLRLMASRGRKYFYYGTDEESQQALAQATGVANPMKPKDFRERNKVVAAAVQPQNVGCRHLRAILGAAPGSNPVRKELAEMLISSIWQIYFDSGNPLREHILLVVQEGALQPAAGYAKIWSPDECPGIAPLIVPNTGKSQIAVHHAAHVEFFRQDLARFFTFRNAILDVTEFYTNIKQMAAASQAASLAQYSAAQPIDVIFTSPFDRWPF
jgi:hypothetical protein